MIYSDVIIKPTQIEKQLLYKAYSVISYSSQQDI